MIIVITFDLGFKMNYSKQRELILQTLKENVVHPSADYIYKIIREKLPHISIATVYRNLNQLAENGEIKKIVGLDNADHFDHNIHKHYHFICQKCEKIYDIPDEIAPEICSKVQDFSGHIIKSHEVTFKGVCIECKVKGEEQWN